MSYILDALKKSEQERQRGSVPDLLTVQAEIVQSPRRSFPWAYLIAAAVLLNAGIAVWWLLPAPAGRPEVPAAAPVQQQASGLKEERQLKAAEQPLPEGETKQPKKEAAPHQADRTALPSNPAPEPTKAERPAVSSEPVSIPPADPGRIYNLKELPAALQKGLPKFGLSAFMYASDPALRMVRINDQMMREGQELSPGLRLQEITAEGVVMTSQGYQFFISMKQQLN